VPHKEQLYPPMLWPVNTSQDADKSYQSGHTGGSCLAYCTQEFTKHFQQTCFPASQSHPSLYRCRKLSLCQLQDFVFVEFYSYSLFRSLLMTGLSSGL